MRSFMEKFLAVRRLDVGGDVLHTRCRPRVGKSCSRNIGIRF
jgi:hypothetical protein